MTAAAVCASCRVPARGHRTLELALAWDMPRVHFGSREKLHLRWVAGLQRGLAHIPKGPFSLPPGLSAAWGALSQPLPVATALPGLRRDPLPSPCTSSRVVLVFAIVQPISRDRVGFPT